MIVRRFVLYATETEWQDDHGFVRVQGVDPEGFRVELFAYDDRHTG